MTSPAARLPWLLPSFLLPLLLAAAPACRPGGDARESPHAPPRAAAPPPPDTAAVLDTLRAVVARNRLTTLPPTCLAFVPDPAAPPYAFDVREVHDAALGCEGDPATAPRLFGIRWDTGGRIITDAWGQVDGVEDTLLGPTYRRAAPR
jgi:hypothetical protein